MSVIPKIKLKYPVAMKWTISEEDLRALIIGRPGGLVRSKFFDVNNLLGVQYFLSMYPNDDDHEGETWIYFCLRYLKNNMKIQADINISIESANYCKKSSYLFEKSVGFGDMCCKSDELLDPEKRFVVDEKMVVKMEGTLMVEKEISEEEGNCFGDPRDALCLGLWNQEESKDFTLVAGGQEITAHKNVLAARSPVFARMFESGMKEAQEGKVKIKDFSFNIVEIAVKLLYHQSLVSYTSLEDKIQLLQFFDKYDIQPHKDNLESYLVTVINELTVCRLVNGALLSNAPKLEESCAEFLQHCLKVTIPISDFELLDQTFAMNVLKNAFCPVSD